MLKNICICDQNKQINRSRIALRLCVELLTHRMILTEIVLVQG